jgi:hypothetical protein
VEPRFGLFGDSVRKVHGLRRTYHRLINRFGCTRWNYWVTWVMWNLIFVCLETMLVSVQDRCIVCAKRTIGSEMVLDRSDGSPR